MQFSGAFDVVRHRALFEKLASLAMHYNIYGWLIDFFNQCSHMTKFGQTISEHAHINASVLQGSTLVAICLQCELKKDSG